MMKLLNLPAKLVTFFCMLAVLFFILASVPAEAQSVWGNGGLWASQAGDQIQWNDSRGNRGRHTNYGGGLGFGSINGRSYNSTQIGGNTTYRYGNGTTIRCTTVGGITRCRY